ncbi:MAG TPA: beta-galactosidase trimerization domain-containing protein, partial [Burkholderiales bacterium]|nr:beta-galactosidase trimerization domain-containing protein [Burkholderiales bacterium]
TFECQRRNTAPWWPGIQAKYLSSLAPDNQRWMTVSYFYPWWRLYATPEAENRAWIAQQFANGVNSWLHINGGYSELFDRRSLAPMREVFARLARWEPYFDGAQSGARVALVFSRHTQDNYAGADTHGKYFDAVRGFYCALLEAHIPFDVISDKFIDTARLARYRVLVLPNVACVDDAGAAAIEAFVAAGGAAVATFDTGMRTRDGGARAEPAFAKMFGVTVRGRRSDLKSSYARIDDAQDPLVAGIGDTDLIPNEGALVEVTAAPGRSVPLTLIPPVIAHSGATISIPEYSAIRATTDVPVAVHGTHGKGRTVYFANPMDALFYRYGFPDLGRVLANAVRHTLADAHNLEVDAPEFVDIALNVQPRRKLVHLINFPVAKQLSTGWRHAGRTLVPLRDIPVRVKLVAGERVRETRVASSEMVIACVQDGEWACVMVPALDDHEIIIFELA